MRWLVSTALKAGGLWIDEATTTEADREYKPLIHTPHIKTCPMMKQFIKPCSSCQAEIVWVQKPSLVGTMPINAESWDGKRIFDHQVHLSHHATCPHAEKWRRPAKKHGGSPAHEERKEPEAEQLGLGL